MSSEKESSLGEKQIRLVKAELKRAETSLKAAQILLKDGLFADSITRSYYAVFHAAKACLLERNQSPSTHKGVFALFHRELVASGFIEADYAKILKEEREERWLGDYSVEEEFDYERADFRLREAQQFVKRVQVYLSQKGI